MTNYCLAIFSLTSPESAEKHKELKKRGSRRKVVRQNLISETIFLTNFEFSQLKFEISHFFSLSKLYLSVCVLVHNVTRLKKIKIL